MIRVIAGANYYADTEPIFKHLRVLKLTDIIYNALHLMQVSKYVLKLLPYSLNNLFAASRTVHEFNTRNYTTVKLF